MFGGDSLASLEPLECPGDWISSMLREIGEAEATEGALW
jgi:hypothetical protein